MRKRKQATRSEVNSCVILAVDTAATSGWSIWRDGLLWRSGEVEVEKLQCVGAVCMLAVACAKQDGLPAVLVSERAFRGNLATAGGLGGAAKIWRASWVEAGGQKSKRLQVYPATWRSRVLGRGMGSARREVARQREQRLAWALAGGPVGPDEAPAICIGLWATHAHEVWAALPKKFQCHQLTEA